jgi:hypothetical protein
MARLNKPVAEVGAQKTGAAGDKNFAIHARKTTCFLEQGDECTNVCGISEPSSAIAGRF